MKLSAIIPSRQSERKLIFDDEENPHSEGYSQSQLAFESGLSLSQIARIETARINPTLSTVFALARTLDVPLSDLFDFELSPKEK